MRGRGTSEAGPGALFMSDWGLHNVEQDPGFAEGRGADALRKGEFLDDCGERAIEDGVHYRKKAGEEIVVGIGGGGGDGALFAEVGAGQGGAEEFFGFVGGRSDDGDEGGPAAKS